jgi:hypothetical protein
MAKQTKQTNQPRFEPGHCLSSNGVAAVVVAADGTAWRIDPQSGTASKVVFK